MYSICFLYSVIIHVHMNEYFTPRAKENKHVNENCFQLKEKPEHENKKKKTNTITYARMNFSLISAYFIMHILTHTFTYIHTLSIICLFYFILFLVFF